MLCIMYIIRNIYYTEHTLHVTYITSNTNNTLIYPHHVFDIGVDKYAVQLSFTYIVYLHCVLTMFTYTV